MFELQNPERSPFSSVDGPNRFNGTALATPHLLSINGKLGLFINGQKSILIPGSPGQYRYAIDTEFYFFQEGKYRVLPDNLSSNPIAKLPKGHWFGGHATLADFDRDGSEEIIWSYNLGGLINTANPQVDYFKLNKNGAYYQVTSPIDGLDLSSSFHVHAAINVNPHEDRDLDLVFQNQDTGAITIYENDGRGNFSPYLGAINLGIPLNDLTKIYSVDHENDGDYDVIVEDGSGKFSFYLNQKGTYVQQFGENNPYGSLDGKNRTVSFYDVDGDGDIDALFLDEDGKAKYYENLIIDGNKPPLVIDDRAKVLSDTSATIDVLRNDWEWEGEVLEIVAFDTVTGKGGTVSLDNNGTPNDSRDDKFIYTSPTGITADTTDSFTYTVKDRAGNQVTGTVEIDIDLDEPPTPKDDNVDVFADVSKSIDVLQNDFEPNSQPLTINHFDITSNLGGKVTLNDNGTPDDLRDDELIYTPPSGIIEKTVDSFTYTVSDDTRNITIATVNVTIIPRLFVRQPENKNPFAGLDAGTTTSDRDFSTPVLVDADGDGDVDLVSGNQNGKAVYFRNDNGTFNQQTGNNNPFNNLQVGGVYGTYSSFAIADFDGDGDQDIVGGDRNTLGYDYWRNDNGKYTKVTGASNPVKVETFTPYYSLVSAIDWDGDGDMDLVTGNEFRYLRLFVNQNGTLQEVSNQNNPFQSLNPDQNLGKHISPAFMDFDRDGDLDLLAGNVRGEILAYRNDDFNQWTQLTGSDHPFGEDIDVDPSNFIERTTLALGDLDGDGDDDLVTGTKDGSFLYWKNITPTSSTLHSDLTPYQPNGWYGPIVISTEEGTNTDAGQITTEDILYIDWAWINQGTTATTNQANFRLLLDDVSILDWSGTLTLEPYSEAEPNLNIANVTDFALEPLAAGIHTLTLEVDYLNQEPESNEENNIFEKDFTVVNAFNPIDGTNGDDKLRGTAKNDLIDGKGGNDQIFGRGGDDLLQGGPGKDTLKGESGDDILHGGAGSDRLYGNKGADQFVLAAGEGTDTVVDYQDEQDSFLLAGGLSFGQLEIKQDNGDTLFNLAGSGELLAILQGVEASQIGAEDFAVLV